jgi:hypothetical protein
MLSKTCTIAACPASLLPPANKNIAAQRIDSVQATAVAAPRVLETVAEVAMLISFSTLWIVYT